MDVAEELMDADHEVDRSYVERRLDDWSDRLAALYDRIAGWLPGDWSIVDGGSVPIREELMRRYEVPERRLPAKAVLKEGRPTGRLVPRGLWIIGANGRVDLTLPNKHLLVVDRSDSFDPPRWRVASIDARRDEKPLSEGLIRDVFA